LFSIHSCLFSPIFVTVCFIFVFIFYPFVFTFKLRLMLALLLFCDCCVFETVFFFIIIHFRVFCLRLKKLMFFWLVTKIDEHEINNEGNYWLIKTVSTHICIKNQIDICLYNSRTYLKVLSYNIRIDLIVSQIIQVLIWW